MTFQTQQQMDAAHDAYKKAYFSKMDAADMTRDDWVFMLSDGGRKPVADALVDKAVDGYRKGVNRQKALDAKGLKVNSRNQLVGMRNVRWNRGQLADATCTYQWQVVVSGNTYPVKDQLKADGFRWDAGDKVWYKAMTPGKSIADNLSDVGDALAGC